MAESGKTGGAAKEDTATAKEAASRDSAKRHGDKLGAATGGAAVEAAASEAQAGDSAKPHGEKLDTAVKAAAKGG